MSINTHLKINQHLCGVPDFTENGKSRVTLETTADMVADDSGLIHGGFVFGLADYAAMIAVNHPNVVLGSADVKFIKPVCVGETVTADASVDQASDKKNQVIVTASTQSGIVFEGTFTCFILKKHILA